MEIISKTKLRDAMLAKCIGVSDLARLADVTAVTISNLLKGDTPCRLPTISKLAQALNIPAKDLLAND